MVADNAVLAVEAVPGVWSADVGRGFLMVFVDEALDKGRGGVTTVGIRRRNHIRAALGPEVVAVGHPRFNERREMCGRISDRSRGIRRVKTVGGILPVWGKLQPVACIRILWVGYTQVVWSLDANRAVCKVELIELAERHFFARREYGRVLQQRV